MQILKACAPLPEFRVIEVDRILPELVEVAVHRKGANNRVNSHVHGVWQLVYLIEGAVRIGISPETSISLKSGSLGCVPANVSHWAHCGPELKHYALSIYVDLKPIELRHPDWKLFQFLSGPQSAHGANYLESYFLQVVKEATTPGCCQRLALQLALDAAVLETIRKIMDPKPRSRIISVHPAVSKALEILETRFREHLTVERLANEVGLSQSRLTELFSQESGYTIQKFLTKIRVRRAENLLMHSDLPVGHVALECGFASIQHFSGVFRRVNGYSPSRFRRHGIPRFHRIDRIETNALKNPRRNLRL
jgi:AraC-like DNA-binding protein